MTNELTSLAIKYDALCQRIKASEIPYSFQTKRGDDGSSYVEFVDGCYHYVTTERGIELSRRSTGENSEILYWLIYDLTFWMSVKFELNNRIEDQDPRRIIFTRWMYLIKQADAAMADKLRLDIDTILAENPFQDQSQI